jgi:ribosomal protein L11 methyltransferase
MSVVKMKWAEVSIQTTNEAIEPIAYILEKHGLSGLVVEDPEDLKKLHRSQFGEVYELNPDDYPDDGVRIKSYVKVNSYLKDTLDELKQDIYQLQEFDIDIGKNEISVSEVDEEDWATAWKKYYKPIRISNLITIKPTWETYTPENKDEVIIELDPGMAFGTGTHPTTMLSIQALEKYIRQNQIVLDVGCGSGVLSIAAAKLGAEKVYAYDLDELAVTSSKQNIEQNNLSDRIAVQQNNLLQGVSLEADVIVSNILAEIIVKFIDDAWNNLKREGIFITSGIIQNKKQLVLDGLTHRGFEVIEVNELEEWISIIAKKP